MSTLAALASAQATPQAQAVLDAVPSSLERISNLFRVAANSPGPNVRDSIGVVRACEPVAV